MTYFTVEELAGTEMLPGITRRAAWIKDVMLTFFTFEPGSVVPPHRHPNEQITIVVRGAMEFSLDGESRVLRVGDGVCIPPNTPHAARILSEPTVAYDAWSPPRDDYRT
ncbi:MAG: cupin domain-containing protein [Candidatus Bipolaricaulis sp.]|nr:cupin domain-containing protein [Candidatus Bipolaricaulis sp.]MDD5219048.1 cupin domain-containing protein [Candidatus Bipolaricaulis sp.]MDD5646473.1 cupin domain-containing protein [Candidatus Bipolaricaulis sp.]